MNCDNDDKDFFTVLLLVVAAIAIISTAAVADADAAQGSVMFKVYEGAWVGVEQQRYINKNGIRGLDEFVNQIKVKWEF